MISLALFDTIGNWWEALTLARQFFYGIGLVAGFFSVVLAVMAVIGLEHHDAVDAVGADLDHGGGGIFSIKPLTGFFLGFGWAGGLAMDGGLSLPLALLCATGAGGAMMGLIVLMFRGILAMRSDGTMRIADSIGAVGTVYITLPASKASGGQVTVNFRNRQETFAALNTANRPVPSGEKIKILAVVDGATVLVEPLA
jgi:hypothetical protein